METILSRKDIERTLRRITHEILERHQGTEDLVLMGIREKGVPIGKIIQDNIQTFEGVEVPFYALDIGPYRDDEKKKSSTQRLFVNLEGRRVILIDDVLYTGRTVRAAMDAIMDLGRPNKVEFAVLVDRGHRELPIRADYVGKNIPTQFNQKVVVDTVDTFSVYLVNNKEETQDDEESKEE